MKNLISKLKEMVSPKTVDPISKEDLAVIKDTLNKELPSRAGLIGKPSEITHAKRPIKQV